MIRAILRHTAMAALMLAALAPAAGCSSDSDGPDPAVKEDVTDMKLRLKVAIAESATGSRADLGDDDGYQQPAGDFEKVRTLRVIILHSHDRGQSEVEANRMVATDDNGVPVNDNLEFRIKSNEMKKVLLIANEAALPLPGSGRDGGRDYTTVSQWLDDLTPGKNVQLSVFTGWTAGYQVGIPTTSASVFMASGRFLPLTEMFDLNTTVTVAEGTGREPPTKEAQLFLTRVPAKATFHFHFTGYGDFTGAQTGAGTSVAGVNVTGVRLSGLSRRQFVFPVSAAYSPVKYVDNDESTGEVNPAEGNRRFITEFKSPDEDPTLRFDFDAAAGFAPVAMERKTDADLRGPIYFPESMSNKATDAYTVQVQLDGDAWLEAKPLQTNILQFGDPLRQAIARNTHLEIHISFSPAGITWHAIEAPYNTVTLDPIFGL